MSVTVQNVTSETQNKFEKIENVSELGPILEERLPISVNVVNNFRNRDNWSSEVTWYTLGGKVSSNSWIVATYTRDDFGQEISVSRPTNGPITSEVQEAFSNASFIDWSKPFLFPAIEPGVSEMITGISIREKGNYTHVRPGNLFYMDIEEGLRLNDKFNLKEGVEVGSIGNEKGKQFLLSTYHYAARGCDEYLRKTLAKNLSSGVYVNGEIVSGCGFSVNGLISMLFTLSDHRGKGYAQSTMISMIKKCAENGLIPGCTVERRNVPSNSFQTKMGFKHVGNVDYIYFLEITGF